MNSSYIWPPPPRPPRTVVLCHGVFDVFHPGHLIHLQEARTLGDILIVGLTADEFVNKGPGRPLFNLWQRKAMLEALAIVDKVICCFDEGPESLIAMVKPQFYVKGAEYKNKLKEQKLVEQYGGKVVFTYDDIASQIKSTKILSFYADKPSK